MGAKEGMESLSPNPMGSRVLGNPKRRLENERRGLLGGDVETSCLLLSSNGAFRVTSYSYHWFVRECDNDAERSPELDYKREIGGRSDGMGYPSPS